MGRAGGGMALGRGVRRSGFYSGVKHDFSCSFLILKPIYVLKQQMSTVTAPFKMIYMVFSVLICCLFVST